MSGMERRAFVALVSRRSGGLATDSAGAAVGQALADRYAGDDTRAGESQF